MIYNSDVTIYHISGLDNNNFEKYDRYNYNKVWFFGGKGASINKGYDNANDVEIRIDYATHDNLDVNNFAIGDVIVQGNLNINIETEQDLKGYLTYKITSIKDDKFGSRKHIHIGGK